MSRFQVGAAGNGAEDIYLIDTEPFDAFLADLHMPGAGDGFTGISATRHKHLDVITLFFTGYSALKESMDAIVLQADEILVKPLPIPEMVVLIRDRLAKSGGRRVSNTKRVAFILEHDSWPTIANRLSAVKTNDELASPPLSDEQRKGHLPQLLQKLVHRLLVPRTLGTKQSSESAVQHGIIRQAQGYSTPWSSKNCTSCRSASSISYRPIRTARILVCFWLMSWPLQIKSIRNRTRQLLASQKRQRALRADAMPRDIVRAWNHDRRSGTLRDQ